MTTYKPQFYYRILILVGLALTSLFAYDLTQGLEVGGILFLTISIGIVLWSVDAAMSVVNVDEHHIIVKRPFRVAKTLQYGQILSVSEEGRLQQIVVITYHPRRADGLLDLDGAQSLTLPAVQRQHTLLESLQDRTPS